MTEKTERYLCIHGHFYQPPRENPWTDTIYIQKSAYPYHDWNERITRECYGPNTRSRLHGENGYIGKLVNNFELISFNFGPTLLGWMERNNPWIYSQIIDADRRSIDRFNGHGNAIAQVYNHLIMPLASKRDKVTQVKWGLADFYHRFGRKAEGMWLAETAVNSETLAVLASEGIRFTILSPYQAHLMRPVKPDAGELNWKDISDGKVDCTRPYRCFPTGDKNLFIDLFFYNGPLSKAIAYEKILASGEVFLKRIRDAYPSESKAPALVSMATDGESYGHHFKFGEMALTWVLEMIENGEDIELTNYGEFLEKFPPEYDVKIVENSAWSCAHGVERWRSDCGCSVSQKPGWTQSWRTPLRNGLNWLNEHLSSIYEENTKDLLKDCWKTRDDYISLLLKPDINEREFFIEKHAKKPLSEDETKLVFRLLESQQMSLYMFTSCGWFFDDISGIEAIQILMYAKKAIELCRNFSEDDLENGLKGFLSEAVCNDKRYSNGLDVYMKKVIPLELDEISLIANYAMVCAMDSDRVPEWLIRLVKSQKEEKISKGAATVFMCEAESSSQIRVNKSVPIVIAIRTKYNELACIVSERDEYSKETHIKEVDDILALNMETESIVKSLNRIEDTRVFTIKDLIPDIKLLVIEILTDQIEKSIYGPFIENRGLVENYLEAVLKADEDVPARFNDLFQLVFLNFFSRLFRKINNLPIEFDEVEKFLELLRREPVEENPENYACTICDNLIKQKRIADLFEEYLFEQINEIKPNKLNLYLDNSINTINFINKYKIQVDWWKCQNTFYDLVYRTNFMQNLDKNSLNLFRQIEHLLGFTGGIKGT